MTKDSRRRLSVIKAKKRGLDVLAVSERRGNGKVFFILVTSESPKRGWWTLLKALRGLYADCEDIVKGTPFSLNGACSSTPSDGPIVVTEDGVKARLLFLAKCVVFRVLNSVPEPLDWPTFRSWMSKNWGITESAPVSELGDDCWLLECASEAEASRIISLGRVFFGSSNVYLDRWLPCAGRTDALRKQGLVWITVDGLPLHLISTDLFRQIGDRCGGFVEASSSACRFGSVRIKIKKGFAIPEEVTIQFLEERFVVAIKEDKGLEKAYGMVVEADGYKQGLVKNSGKLINKGKGKLVPSVPRKWCIVQGQCSSGMRAGWEEHDAVPSPPEDRISPVEINFSINRAVQV
ncbi:hypothetical protein LINGRAPRIM_LOCUS1951 [Linum grandiflorum]